MRETVAPRHSRALLFTWTVAIVLMVSPVTGFAGHPHLERVGWLPFEPAHVVAADMVQNVLGYMPLGFLAWRAASGRRSPALGILAGAALLSLTTEASQIFSHSRYPSMTDVSTNVIGTWLGIVVARLAWVPLPAGPANAGRGGPLASPV